MSFSGILRHARTSFADGVGSGYLGDVSRADIERASGAIPGPVVRTPLLPYAAAMDRTHLPQRSTLILPVSGHRN
jgi:threonine dehydratase